MIKGTPNEGINGTLANGLLAHYSFNDGSLQDMSGNNNNAIAVGTPALGVDKDGQEGQACCSQPAQARRDVRTV